MAFGFAASLLNSWLDTGFATVFVRLVIGDPGASGTANGAAGNTTRQAQAMAAAAGGSKAATGADPSWVNGGVSETITGVALFDAAAAGNFEASGTLTAAQAWGTGNTFTLTNLVITLTPVAA